MVKEFTSEMMEKLIAANDSVRGTVNYTKYLMEVSYNSNGKWKFLTHYPNELVWDIPFRMWQYCWSRWVRG